MALKDGQVFQLPNNAILSLNEAFGMGSSLLCITERRPCCSSPSEAGGWYYQNGTAVSSYDQGYAFYTSRGDDGAVRLHTRDNNTSLMNTSQFCCEILNINDLNQKLCVKICDSDCVATSEEMTGTTTAAAIDLTRPMTTHQTLSKQSTSVGATVGYVVIGLAAILCIAVAIAIVAWKYSPQQLKVTRTQNT